MGLHNVTGLSRQPLIISNFFPKNYPKLDRRKKLEAQIIFIHFGTSSDVNPPWWRHLLFPVAPSRLHAEKAISGACFFQPAHLILPSLLLRFYFCSRSCYVCIFTPSMAPVFLVLIRADFSLKIPHSVCASLFACEAFCVSKAMFFLSVLLSLSTWMQSQVQKFLYTFRANFFCLSFCLFYTFVDENTCCFCFEIYLTRPLQFWEKGAPLLSIERPSIRIQKFVRWTGLKLGVLSSMPHQLPWLTFYIKLISR